MTGHTYLISGGCGFLGQYIVKAVKNYDPPAEIRVLDLCPRPTFLGIEQLAGVKVISADLRRPETYIVDMCHVDTVIHCAGVVTFNGNAEDPATISNISGMRNLLQAAIDFECRNFIFISSISAVDRQPGQISDETMIPDRDQKRQSDPYGYSKLVAESELLAKKDRIRGIILNPSVILGPGSVRIEKILRWLRWVPFLPMISNMNSFVDVRDVAEAVVLSLTKGTSGERYIVTAENMDNRTFMSMVLAAMKKRAPVFPVPNAIFSIYDSLIWLFKILPIKCDLKKSSEFIVDKAYCNDKIRREMGWQPAYTMAQSVHHMILTPQEKYGAKRQDRLAYRSL